MAPMLVWSSAGLVETAKRIRVGKFGAEQVLGLAALLFVLVNAGAAIPSMSTRWEKVSNIQLVVETLVPDLRPGDLVLVGYPNNPPAWYYLMRAGVDEVYWVNRGKFTRAFLVLSTNERGQTLEGVIKTAKMDPGLFDLPNAKEIGRFGRLYVYLCQPAR